jgi:hypothetical protein
LSFSPIPATTGGLTEEHRSMGFDVSKLKTSAEAQNLMNNARRMGREDIYQAAFARKCELESQAHDDPNDPMVKDFWVMIAAYEQLLSEKNEKRTAPSGLRGRETIRRHPGTEVYEIRPNWPKNDALAGQ